MPQEAVEQINRGPEPLVSQFKSGYSLVLNLLSKYSLEEAKVYVSRSFRNYMARMEENEYAKEIKQIQEKANPLRVQADKLEDEKKTFEESVEALSMVNCQLQHKTEESIGWWNLIQFVNLLCRIWKQNSNP